MSSMATKAFLFPLIPYNTVDFHSTQNKQTRIQLSIENENNVSWKRIVEMNGECEYEFEKKLVSWIKFF